ncbi:hypothetical protein ILUMI_05364 [Ignelater luminosus]|uniref:Uncharacterized protein n=1 Tax=Ignelater luminosus TaxID=2038154 RepID=A0A8K0GDM8_IGNLU|nr:hypothetical protein ILUMI_05364 [Ignelater luminosus]
MKYGIVLLALFALLISACYAGKLRKYPIILFLKVIKTKDKKLRLKYVFYSFLASEYQICKRDNPNYSECMKNAIQDALTRLDNGIPTLNVPPLQPLNIPSITIGEGKGAVNVVQKYKNFNLYDVGKSIIEKIEAKATPNDLKLEVELLSPETRFEADYSFNGRVLLLPIVGDGKCTVTLQQVKITINLYAETFEKKEKKYLKVKNVTLKLVPGKVIYNFENLFNGDERLGNEMNRLLNDNWKDVYDDIGDQYAVALQTVFADYADKVFSKVPFEEIS